MATWFDGSDPEFDVIVLVFKALTTVFSDSSICSLVSFKLVFDPSI